MAKTSEIAKGLEIFLKYGDGYNVSAEHDEFFAGPPDGVRLSLEDRAALKELGWMNENDDDDDEAEGEGEGEECDGEECDGYDEGWWIFT